MREAENEPTPNFLIAQSARTHSERAPPLWTGLLYKVGLRLRDLILASGRGARVHPTYGQPFGGPTATSALFPKIWVKRLF